MPRSPSASKNPLLPDYTLTIDLLGGNGHWRQRKAREEWERQLRLREEKEKERRLKEERLRIRRAEEAERQKKREEAERRRRMEEQERERRLKEEKERIRRQKEEEERLRKLEEERQWRLRQPRMCEVCSGSGKCTNCYGEGFFQVTYLTSNVGKETNAAYGRRPRGCEACSGCGDDAAWGEFDCGSGKCANCNGTGDIKAPPGGWPS